MNVFYELIRFYLFSKAVFLGQFQAQNAFKTSSLFSCLCQKNGAGTDTFSACMSCIFGYSGCTVTQQDNFLFFSTTSTDLSEKMSQDQIIVLIE